MKKNTASINNLKHDQIYKSKIKELVDQIPADQEQLLEFIYVFLIRLLED